MTDVNAGGADPGGARFSLVIGGPFHRVLTSVHATGADGLPTWIASLTIALIAWLPLGLLAFAEAHVDATYEASGFWRDPSAHARYLLAIAVLIWTERVADGRLQRIIASFRHSGLIPRDSLPAYFAALRRADRVSSSAVAEGIAIAIAIVVPGFAIDAAVYLSGQNWEGGMSEGGASLSWAGTWARVVAFPLYFFLLLRWLWRFVVWAHLLARIARLPLRLVPLHADGAGGLGFLTIYPTVFTGFAFAISAVVAATFVKEVGYIDVSDSTVRFGVLAWLAIVLAILIGPLLVFSRKLYNLRETALLDYSRLVTQHHRAFHDRWVDVERDGRELLASAEVSSLSDINAAFGTLRSLKQIPVERATIAQLLTAAGLPMLAVIATRMPLTEFFQRIGGALL